MYSVIIVSPSVRARNYSNSTEAIQFLLKYYTNHSIFNKKVIGFVRDNKNNKIIYSIGGDKNDY